MNKLITIGWIGSKVAYLNIPREEAISRWKKENNGEEPTDKIIEEFEFVDTFFTYDCWT